MVIQSAVAKLGLNASALPEIDEKVRRDHSSFPIERAAARATRRQRKKKEGGEQGDSNSSFAPGR